jgi:DNA-binding response OmpR family regulator
MSGSSKILLIEDDREISTTLTGVLRGAGYDVVTAANGIEGQRLIVSESPALVITDMMMPKMGGFPVLDFINTLSVKPAVIMITANEGGRHKAYAEMLGVVEYLRKPFPMESLLDAVQRALQTKAGGEPASASSEPPLGPLRRSRAKKKTEE